MGGVALRFWYSLGLNPAGVSLFRMHASESYLAWSRGSFRGLFSSSPGRCLGGVTSSFRASESDVRHFSWVVWRCVFATPWT